MDYCGELATALSRRCAVTAIGFSAMYPAFLYRGGKRRIDPTKAALDGPNLTVHHKLTYYNPLGWIAAAVRTKADVFHVQWWSLALFPICFTMMLLMKLRGKRIVITLHNVLPHEKGGTFVIASRLLCAMADRVIVHSEKNRAQAIERYRLPEGRVALAPMGVYEKGVVVREARDARRQLGLPGDSKIILLFGALRAYKAIPDLISAFKPVAERIPGVRLVIAGKPWLDWAPLDRQISEAGLKDKIDLHLEYVPAEKAGLLFSAADLVVLPYRHFDAQSAVAAQTLAYRKPLIVTRVGGLPDWVQGDPSWIAEPGDPEDLARKMIDFFEAQEAKSEEFESIARRVRAKFSWDRAAQRHMEIYGLTEEETGS